MCLAPRFTSAAETVTDLVAQPTIYYAFDLSNGEVYVLRREPDGANRWEDLNLSLPHFPKK